MTFETILYDVSEGLATITLNRPDVMNGLNTRMRAEIRAAVEQAGKEARALVLTGSGRGFCSGQDLADTAGKTVDMEQTLHDEYEPMLRAIYDCPIPTLAAVNGAAARLAIEAVDPRIEAAAATLGAPRISVFCRVTLPLIFPGILAGAVMGFAKAMGEFGATITFVANIPGQTQTLPSAIWTALQVPGGESRALTMAALAGLVALAAVLLSEALARRVARRISGAR